MLQSRGFLKHYSSIVVSIQRLLDAFLVVFSLYLISKYNGRIITYHNILLFGFIFTLTLVIFKGLNLYQSWRGASITSEFKRILLGWFLIITILVMSSTLFYTPKIFTQDVFLSWLILTPLGITLEHAIIRLTLRYFRSQGKNVRHVIIAGAGQLGTKLHHKILNSPGFGLKIMGFFDDKYDEGLKDVHGIPVLGNLNDLPQYVSEREIDIVYIALPFRAEEKMKTLANALSDSRTSVFVIPDIFIFQLLHTRLIDLDGIPIFSIFDTHFNGIDGWLKRLFDIIVASLILVLISPVMLLISVGIKLSSKGPIVFKQRRYGLNGDEIIVYKFRSMKVCEDGKNVPQAQKNDPRITPFGNFIRKTSLDELPQFINVIQGRMSIVGPRPHAISHNEHYRKLIDGYMLRHKVKPGITGWAQINGWRGETDTLYKMEKRVEYDLDYIRNWSIWLDIEIILLTIIRGFTGKNAY